MRQSLHVDGAKLEGITRAPFPASKKLYEPGRRFPELRVPLREVALTDTRHSDGRVTHNAAVRLYDTTGPYTDPELTIDLKKGLAPLRESWLSKRGDVEQLPKLSSEYGRARLNDKRLDGLRFHARTQPYRARSGRNVSQMAYAKRGEITAEMEFVA